MVMLNVLVKIVGMNINQKLVENGWKEYEKDKIKDLVINKHQCRSS